MDNNEFHDSSFKTHSFLLDLIEAKIIYRVLQMKDSLFIYISDSVEQSFDAMGVGFPIRDNKNEVTSTGIFGDMVTDSSRELAEKLARRLKKPVFISCNLFMDNNTQPQIEGRLIEEVKNNPQNF